MTTSAEPSTLLADATDGAEKQLAVAKPFPSGRLMALAPHTLEQATTLAQVLCKADMLPKQYHDKPADVLVAIMFGADLGLPPMQALQSIATINGKPSIYGDGLLAVVYGHPAFRDHQEYYMVGGERVDPENLKSAHLQQDDTAAVCAFWRHGRTQPTVRKFSVGQAKNANLWTKSGPWKDYPDRMLLFRARGFAARDAFPDALRGILTEHEARDIPGEVITVEEIKMPQRASAAEAATSTAAGSGGDSQSASQGGAVAPAAAEQVVTSAPSSPLPAGADRIVQVERPRADKPTLALATTERGQKLYAFDSRANLTELKGKVVRLILGTQKWGDYTEVMKAEVVS